MHDLIVAAGLVLVLEGLIWALAPGSALQLLEFASRSPERSLRTAGAVAVLTGFVIVWAIRG